MTFEPDYRQALWSKRDKQVLTELTSTFGL
jgi:hypothetical protein